ncbi:Crp/Fnr family transcriptional regulator [Dokdonia ponticola]|uniref:Crp/Fnr family transcriptional regulator n=1 Tax=Dokdonia ponticola TaxID=2041041 RepID=A0ABV9I0G3_9FLAO
MNYLNFNTFLTSTLEIDENEISSMIESCMVKTVKKEEFLLRKDENCKHSFFVEKGLLRQYSIDEKGKEHILSFAPEGWIVTDRESVYFNQPSAYVIQAMENSQVILLDEHFFQILSKKFPKFTDFNNRLLHNHIRHLKKRIKLLLSAVAKDRYLEFIKMYPDIVNRVPQTMIASYLGITPESLSRVRKELIRENFKH